jgi:HlyD family secretion protein
MPAENVEPQKKRNRRLLWAGIGLVVVALAAFIFIRMRRQGSDVHFETAPVQRGRIVARVTATGTLSALVTVQVGAQVSGRILSLHADFNTAVKKGQVVARIDPQLFDAAVEQAHANLVEAEGNLAKAKVQAIDSQRQQTRTQSLKARDLVAQAELDTATANLEAAKAQVEVSKGAVAQAKAALNQAKVNLAYTTIYSPIDGVVISRNVDVGQTVASALQAPTLFTIAEDLRKMQVHTNVAEADIGKLAPNMTAIFTVDAYPTEQFRGTIHEVRNAAQTVQNVVTYDAVIDVLNPDLKLRPGMTANVTVVYAQKDDVLRVANAALRFKPGPEVAQPTRVAGGPGGQQRPRQPDRGGAQAAQMRPGGRSPDEAREINKPGERTVWLLNSRPRPVTVQIGVTDGTVTEVVSGPIEEGDVVITGMSGVEPSRGPQPPGGGFRRPF